jgi:phosphoserine phosphatase RsbU/P
LKTDLDQLPNESLLRILDLTQKLLSPFDLSQMLTEVLQAGLEVMHADSGSIWLYDDSSDILEMHLPKDDPPITVKAGEGLVGECLAENKVINVRDCYSDARFNPEVDRKTGYQTRSLLSIPLIGFEQSLVGVMQLLNKDGGPFTAQDELLALALAAQSAVALQRTQMTEATIARERLDEEVEIARQIQLSTLPDEMPEIEDYDFCGNFLPAAFTGGDMFDLVTLEEEVFILMGDATGHGFGPALSATQMQAMLRVALRLGATLDQAYIHVNNQLSEDLPDDKFLTAFVGFLDRRKHTIRYHSGGQGPLLHYRASSGSCEWYSPTSFPVGIMEISSLDPAQEIFLQPGDIFAVISDGVYEYHNESGEQFGEERASRVFQTFGDGSTEELKNELLKSVFAFGGKSEQLDDITIVLVKRNPVAHPAITMHDRDLNELEKIVNLTEAFFAENVIDTSIRVIVDFAIEEIFVNMVKYNTGTEAQIQLEMETLRDGVKVSLIDFDVERFDPTEHGDVDINAPLEERTPGGLGIFLTLKMVDSVDYDYRDRVSRITFTKYVESR